MQAMEYERDRRFVGRRKGRYGCMTGMAAMYRVRALYDVKAHYGAFYDQDNWTEDWFLTIALKHLGWRMLRPQDCMAATVPVPTLRGLFTQRVRWARGYLQTLRKFGFTRYTAIPGSSRPAAGRRSPGWHSSTCCSCPGTTCSPGGCCPFSSCSPPMRSTPRTGPAGGRLQPPSASRWRSSMPG